VLEESVFFTYGQSMVMMYGDPMMRRVNEVIQRVVEAGIDKFWDSLLMNWQKYIPRR
jgi:hypothetical protein